MLPSCDPWCMGLLPPGLLNRTENKQFINVTNKSMSRHYIFVFSFLFFVIVMNGGHLMLISFLHLYKAKTRRAYATTCSDKSTRSINWIKIFACVTIIAGDLNSVTPTLQVRCILKSLKLYIALFLTFFIHTAGPFWFLTLGLYRYKRD